ncbi:MAG TPA: DUF2752 domain-containing protein [bacterium]|nr:DUF2752 domain-containing protein [bacterium]
MSDDRKTGIVSNGSAVSEPASRPPARGSFFFWSNLSVVGGIAFIFAAAYLLPALGFFSRINICAVKSFTGYPCPGCGLTRSLSALTHGDLRACVDAHPLGPVVALWLFYFAARAAWAAFSGRRPPELLSQRGRDICTGAFVVALFLQWAFHLAII